MTPPCPAQNRKRRRGYPGCRICSLRLDTARSASANGAATREQERENAPADSLLRNGIVLCGVPAGISLAYPILTNTVEGQRVKPTELPLAKIRDVPLETMKKALLKLYKGGLDMLESMFGFLLGAKDELPSCA
ncbi:hypothetical protein HDU86_000375 [Geranomyces michiganensis]|nr:hypothetical protein HDU86_000375 [Geranomyces michiganensis]